MLESINKALSAKILDMYKAILASPGVPTMHPWESKSRRLWMGFGTTMAMQISLD
jgi:hypothetical protein